MLSSGFETSPRLRSLGPMSTPQLPATGTSLAPGLPPAQAGSVAIGPPPVPTSSVVSAAPGAGVIKNGSGMLGMEEEVNISHFTLHY